jgi:hypothetical protein
MLTIKQILAMKKIIQLSSQTPTNELNSSVAIYWDFENVRIPNQVKCLIDFARSRGDVVTKKVYSHWWRETWHSKCELYRYGFERVDVQEEFKNSADLKLKSDCLAELLSSLSPDIIILVSGDKGFASLVRELRLHGKQVIVFGRRGVTSYKLIDLADKFYFAEQLCQLVG